ncbi:MAG: lytic murein transglycosylase [Hyphomicrobiaceae bacterium]
MIAATLAAVVGLTPAARGATPAEFATFVETVWPQAEAQGVSRETFDRAFKGITPDFSLPDLELPGRQKHSARGQAEFTRPPQDYLDARALERLASQGRTLLAKYAGALDTIERRIGVDRAVVLAIWGRETAFGTHKLKHNTIRVLATLAYAGRRKDLFRRELIFALRMLQDRLVAPADMRSSWAGAMGLTQFMPSEFYSSAVDIDGDGRIDLIHSVPDALGSAARQLQLKGWTKGLPWGFEVKTGARVDCANEGPLNARPLAGWAGAGVVRVEGGALPRRHAQASAYLMSPGGTYGPQFLVTENFKVLRAYNTSDLYAVYVGHLADRIAGGGNFKTRWSAIAQLPTRDLAEMQERLKGLGYAIDKIDGKIGSNTRWQIGLYQRASRQKVDCWPTVHVLESLREGAKP